MRKNLIVALAALTLALNAHAAMDCQQPGDFVIANYDRQTFWTNCGFWYEEALPYTPPIVLPPIVEPPVIDPHIPAVPEPASWALFAAGLVVIGLRRWRA